MMRIVPVGFKFVSRLQGSLPEASFCSDRIASAWGDEAMSADITIISYSAEEITKRRAQVGKGLLDISATIDSPDFSTISVADLEILLNLYDQIFMKGWVKQNLPGRLQFSISRQMTKTAGKTICKRKATSRDMIMEVRISLPILANYGRIEGLDKVGGIKSASRLEALQLIFEHELVHVLEYSAYGSSSCKRQRFQTMAGNLFGHTNNYHQLSTDHEIARRGLGLAPGVRVAFNYENDILEGTIYNIRKRAAVMVLDKNGSYQDQQGRCYSKYLVPLQLLQPLQG